MAAAHREFRPILQAVPSPPEPHGFARDRVETALGKLTIREQACHAFFQGDYQRVVGLLGGLPMETVSLGELFLIAFSNDENGLSQPDVAHAYFDEILRRQPHSFWRAEAEQGLKTLGRNPEP